MTGVLPAAANLPPLLGLGWSASCAAIVAALVAIAELIELFPLSPTALLFRLRSVLYVMLNVGLAVIALAGLRYLTEPNSRVSELEQIALAGISARVVLTGLGHASAKTPSEAVDGRAQGARDHRHSFLDTVMGAVTRDLQTEESRRQTQLVACLDTLQFDGLRRVMATLLLSQVVERQSEDRQKEFKDNLATVDNTSLTDEDAARDVMIMLAWNWAGEEWVRSALKRYLASYEANSPWVVAASLGLDSAPPWWAWRMRRARKGLLGPEAGRGPQPKQDS